MLSGTLDVGELYVNDITIKLFFKRQRLGLPGTSSGRKPSPSYILWNNKREQYCRGPLRHRDPEEGIPARAVVIGRLSQHPNCSSETEEMAGGEGRPQSFSFAVLQAPVDASH